MPLLFVSLLLRSRLVKVFKVAVNPKTTNFYNGIARAIFLSIFII